MALSVVEQKKESIRAALQELDNPTIPMSTYEAMYVLQQTLCEDFDDDDSIGDFVGDDDFKEEIFSARVIQVVMDVSQDKSILQHFITLPVLSFSVFAATAPNSPTLSSRMVELNSFWSVWRPFLQTNFSWSHALRFTKLSLEVSRKMSRRLSGE
jgi:hypothetical protein